MKVKSKIFKGIEYIQIAELPQEQQEILAKTLNKNIIIKILMNGKVVRDCIQFKDYQTWYENIFKSKPLADDLKEKSKSISRKEVKASN
jgi:hypothetical protein